MILDREPSSWSTEEKTDQPGTPVDLYQQPQRSVTISDPGFPTGTLDIVASQQGSAVRIAAQAAVVVLAALVAGTAVFFVIRSAVGSDGDVEDEAALDDESALIEPGPAGEEIPDGEDASRSGSRRSTDGELIVDEDSLCLLYTSPSPRDATLSRMPSSA